MTFSIFLPERKQRRDPNPPVLYYLSGLTCTDENVRTKSHFAQEAGRVGLAVVFPDTSPRGVSIEGQDESWDFGSGAGFYVNATESKWSKHYKMYDYVTKELPRFIEAMVKKNLKLKNKDSNCTFPFLSFQLILQESQSLVIQWEAMEH